MAVVFEMRNTRTILPLCQFGLHRFTLVGHGWFAQSGVGAIPWETPCSVCLLPGGYCHNVSVNRVFHVEVDTGYMLAGWAHQLLDPDAEATFETLIAQDMYDPIILQFSSECHWTDDRTASGESHTVKLEWNLRADKASPNPTLTNFTLSVRLIFAETPNPGTAFVVNYRASNVDPVNTDPIVFTPVNDNRTFNIDEDNWITFPDGWVLTPEDVAP